MSEPISTSAVGPGSGGEPWAVDIDAMTAAAKQFKQISGTMTDLVDSLTKEMTDLVPTTWQGQAATAFLNRFTDWSKRGKAERLDHLDGYVTALPVIAGVYQTAHDQVGGRA